MPFPIITWHVIGNPEIRKKNPLNSHVRLLGSFFYLKSLPDPLGLFQVLMSLFEVTRAWNNKKSAGSTYFYIFLYIFLWSE